MHLDEHIMLVKKFARKRHNDFATAEFTRCVPTQFFLLTTVIIYTKGQCFLTVEDVKQKSLSELKAVPKNACLKYFEDYKMPGLIVSHSTEVTLKGVV